MNEVNENQVYKKYIRSCLKKDKAGFCPFRKEKQMDYLFSFLRQDFEEKNQRILDACCGYGRLIYFLNEFDSRQLYLGVDYVEELIDQGKQSFVEEKNVKFEFGDILEISKRYKKHFDISINYKTLSWLPYYKRIMEELFKVTKKKIYITSLFYDGDIDFITKIYKGGLDNADSYTFLNSYSSQRFKKFCEKLGAKSIEFIDMNLDFDLPKSKDLNLLETYTLNTNNNERLEITGNVILNWKLVVISL